MKREQNPEVVALQALCDREGDFRVVAKAIGVNDQSLYQILAGVRMASGRAKGIGPRLKEKLSERYPGWNDAVSAQIADKVLHAQLMTIAGALAAVDPASRRTAYLDALEAISLHHPNSLMPPPDQKG